MVWYTVGDVYSVLLLTKNDSTRDKIRIPVQTPHSV